MGDVLAAAYRTLPDPTAVAAWRVTAGAGKTTMLADADGGTRVVMEHVGVPDSVPSADNETGMGMALDSLADCLESRTRR